MKARYSLIVALMMIVSVAAVATPLSQLVPADAYFVVNCDFAAIVRQPEIKSVLDYYIQTGAQDLTDFYQRAGMNPMKDFKNVVLFLDNDNQPGIIINGNFNTAEISKLIQTDKGLAENFTVAKIGGLQAIKNNLNEMGNLVFVNQNTVAFGSEKILSAVAAIAHGKGKNITSHKHFSGLVEQVDTDSQLWGVIIPSPNWEQRANLPATNVQDMTSAFFSLDYGKEFIFIFTGMVEKKEQLPAFAEGMEQILDAFKGWVASVPEMHALMQNAHVMNNQETLARIVLRVPAEEFKATMSKTAERANQPGN